MFVGNDASTCRKFLSQQLIVKEKGLEISINPNLDKDRRIMVMTTDTELIRVTIAPELVAKF